MCEIRCSREPGSNSETIATRSFCCILIYLFFETTELEQVVLPNLYFQLFLRYITLSATILSPGRLWSNDLSEDATFLQFLVDSGLPLVDEEISRFLHHFSAWIQRKYRTTVTQAKLEPHTETLTGVLEHLKKCSHSYRKGYYDLAIQVIKPLIQQFRLADIIYRDYRSSSIHEFTFSVDNRFFSQPGTFFTTRYHACDDTRFLELCLSAQWIIDLYKVTVLNYERSLRASKKIPLDLWVQICDGNKELECLDDASVQVGRDLTIHVER